MLVIYRITDIPSTNPSPWSQDNKRELSRVCLKSFVEAYKDINPHIYFIADHCDRSVGNMIDSIVPFDFTVEHTEVGINETMNKSYRLATEYDGYVLFQECDYLYRPGIGKSFLKALESLDIISPYNHRNFYVDKNIHSTTCDLTLIDDQIYRSVERNTMTWATHTDIVRQNRETFLKYGYLDDLIWRDLLIAGHQLYVPIPSFATHCVKDYLAPGIDWESLWNKYK